MKIIAFFVMIIIICAFPNLTISGASDGINTCLYTVLPSLFPFFVVSKMLIFSGGAAFFGRFLHPVMKILFNVSGNGAASFVLGTVSGYPIGAASVCETYKRGEISKNEAQNLLGFCNNSGPCFLIGAIGEAMLGSRNLGFALYIIHILASISVGFLLGRSIKPSKALSKPAQKRKTDIFTSAVEESVISILNVCGYIVFFSVVIKFINSVCKSTLVSGFFEMTTAAKNLAADGSISIDAKIVIISFLCGWAGLSVNMQTKRFISQTDLSFIKYLYSKLLHACIAGVFALVYVKIFPHSVSVMASFQTKILPGGITNMFLLLTALIFTSYLFKRFLLNK